MVKKTIFLLFLITSGIAFGQDSTEVATDTTVYNSKDDFSLAGFPIVFFLPETSWSFGAAGLLVFNAGTKEKAWRRSQISLGGAYTLKRQILFFLPYELYLKQNWKLNGEVGYFRYFFNYYGIGIDSKAEDLETYDANFPRLISNLSYRVTDPLLLGVQYKFDYFDIPRTDSLLTADNPIGIDGGALSSIGLTASYDSRDDIFYPRKGIFASVIAESAGAHTGSDFDYSLITIDLRHYKTFKWNHTLATNFYSGITIGDSPFFNYFYFSSGRRGRGFNDRRFLDKNISMFQAEYRFGIYKRFRGTLFSSIGSVGNTYGETFTNRKLWSYGGGLRYQLSKKQMSHVRLDVAHGFEGFYFYVTIGEAF